MTIKQLFCRHERVKKTDGARLFTECLWCGQQSPGIVTGVDMTVEWPEYQVPRTEVTCLR